MRCYCIASIITVIGIWGHLSVGFAGEIVTSNNGTVVYFDAKDDFDIFPGISVRNTWSGLHIDQYTTCNGSPACLAKPMADGKCIFTTDFIAPALSGYGEIIASMRYLATDKITVTKIPTYWPNYHLFDLRLSYTISKDSDEDAGHLRVVEKSVYTTDLNRFIKVENPEDPSKTDMISTTEGWAEVSFEVANEDQGKGVDNIKLSICRSSVQSMTIDLPVKIRTLIF